MLSILYLRCSPLSKGRGKRDYLGLSILYLRCRRRGGLEEDKLAHQLSILYLRCGGGGGWEALPRQVSAFNSLFEMPAYAAVSVELMSAWTFNSLFEMPEGRSVLVAYGPYGRLSILYLRCACRRRRWQMRSTSTTFNSLFEMPPFALRGAVEKEKVPFNSLFEMHSSTRYSQAGAAGSGLSILYLRCKLTEVDVTLHKAHITFQFSI